MHDHGDATPQAVHRLRSFGRPPAERDVRPVAPHTPSSRHAAGELRRGRTPTTPSAAPAAPVLTKLEQCDMDAAAAATAAAITPIRHEQQLVDVASAAAMAAAAVVIGRGGKRRPEIEASRFHVGRRADAGSTLPIADRRFADSEFNPELRSLLDVFTGARSNTHENLFLGTQKRLVLCCLDSDAKNLLHAKNNATNFVAVYVDGRQISSKPFQPNFDNNLFIRSYLNPFYSTVKVWQDEGNEMFRSDFRHGYTFFGFDLRYGLAYLYRRMSVREK